MSSETKPKRTRSTKKSNTAELEAKIAELEAKIAGLSSQVRPSETKSQTRAHPPEPKHERTYEAPTPSEVAPAYSATSSTSYTGNKYYATRARLAYHPPDKQFKGSTASTSTRPSPPEPRYAPEPSTSYSEPQREKRREEKRSMWKAKGASYEDYAPQEERRAPPPPRREEPKPAPRPEPKQEVSSYQAPSPGEVAPAYATTSSTGYTGNKYYATRRRLAYHPANKQFTGASTTEAQAPAPEPPKPKKSRGTLPAGFKP